MFSVFGEKVCFPFSLSPESTNQKGLCKTATSSAVIKSLYLLLLKTRRRRCAAEAATSVSLEDAETPHYVTRSHKVDRPRFPETFVSVAVPPSESKTKRAENLQNKTPGRRGNWF